MRITNNETAKQWLDVNGYHYTLNDSDKVRIDYVCNRCGGTGYWARGHWNQGGICFACGGSGGKHTNYVSIKAYAQDKKAIQTRREKEAKKAAEKEAAREAALLEGQRNWCEKNGYGRITFEEREAQKKQERQQAQKTQSYLGEVKDRLEFEVTYNFTFSFEGFYGITYIHRFLDDEGNILIWKTSKGLYYPDNIEKGDRCLLKGTVKEHQEYKGDKQTVLTRCKVSKLSVEKAG